MADFFLNLPNNFKYNREIMIMPKLFILIIMSCILMLCSGCCSMWNPINWFFELPILEKTIEGKKITGRYGFLTYLAIGNLSRRPVGINSWHLTLPGKTGGVDAITISEPQITLYSAKKAYPVLGIKTENHKGETYLPGGGGTAGFAYYDVEVYGEPLKESNGKITGFVKCKDIYGNTAKTAIVFKKIDIKKLRKIIPNFDGDKNKEKSREYDKLLDD